MERLTDVELARTRAEHYEFGGTCVECSVQADKAIPFPCTVARLLDHFAPGPVPYLAGLAYGLLGPQNESELAR